MSYLKKQSTSTDEAILLQELKRVLKEKNIRYVDVARHLNVSETTIKRKLSSQGLSISTLESICTIAGIRLIELAELAGRRHETKAESISEAQEKALAEKPFSAFIFLLLRYNWTPYEIQQEFNLNEADIILHLRYLEKIRLIDLFPGNRVRLLTVRYPRWIPGGPLRRAVDETLRHHFETMDFHDPQSVWELETVKISERSIDRLRQLIASIAEQMRELAAQDHDLPAEQKKWYSMLCTARLTDPRIFWSNKHPGDIDGSVSQ